MMRLSNTFRGYTLWLFAILMMVCPLSAQRPALNSPVIRFSDTNGKPLVGGTLQSYSAGTTTPLATYRDSTTGTLNTNPVVLDSTGSATVFLGANVYKFVLKNSAGVVQWTADNIAEGMFQASYVNSVFGRTGTVVAVSGDYNCSQITGAICSLPTPPTLYNQTIQVSGSSKPQEPILNFIPGVLGSVVSPTITAPGSGYTGAPTVTFSGGTCTVLPTGAANVASGAVTSLVITTAGSGCVTAPTVAFSGGGGTGAAATVALQSALLSCVDNPSNASTDCTFPTGGSGTGTAYVLTDVTASRSLGSTYQNTTNSVMFISGSANTTGSGVGNISVAQGVSSASLTVWANQATATVSMGDAGFSAAIMPGYYYAVNGSGAVGALRRWVEITGSGSGGGSGVSAIVPGTNVTCTPLVSGSCTGAVTVNATGGGGGGATLPFPCLVWGTSGTTGTCATPVQVADTLDVPISGQADNFYLTTTPPSAPNGGNTIVGVGAGGNMVQGAHPGSQFDTIVGYQAGFHVTTAREGTIIGNGAGYFLTGNNSGADDMIFDLIGSDAGGNLTNCGGAGVMIGQKSGVSNTCSSQDVFVGVHSATNATTSDNTVVIGGFGLDAFTGNITHTVAIGSEVLNSGTVYGGTISNTVAIGTRALQNIIPTSGSTGNVAIGEFAGASCTTCNNNIFIGNNAGGSNSPTMTGSHNVIVDADTGGNNVLTSGIDNILIDVQSTALTTGSDNFYANEFAGNGATTGSHNIAIGAEAERNTGASASDLIAMGNVAGNHAQNGQQVFIGDHSGTALSGGVENTAVGHSSMIYCVSCMGDTVIGFNAFTTPIGTEANDEAIGDGADIATGISNSAEIGPGQNTISHTIAFNGYNFLTDAGVASFATGSKVNASLICTAANSVCPGGTTTVIQVNGTNTASATPVNLQTGTGNGGIVVTNPSVGNVQFNLSKPIAGAGTGFTTGPTSGTTANNFSSFTGTTGQLQDSGFSAANFGVLVNTQTWSGVNNYSGGVNLSSFFTLGGSQNLTAIQGTTGTKLLAAGTVSGTAATLCTDANGNATTSGCSGGGNTTSTSLTSNTLPKANGANSIINSNFTDNGSIGGYAGSGGFGPTHLFSGDINACKDTSGSGTAQTCNTTSAFTPIAASCVNYLTTTANTGTGLTVNINALSAHSVAIPGTSGWTTTLTAGIIPANEPLYVCYDGTNWNVTQTGTVASGGGTGAQYSLAYFSALNIVGGITPAAGVAVYSASAAPTIMTLAPTGTVIPTVSGAVTSGDFTCWSGTSGTQIECSSVIGPGRNNTWTGTTNQFIGLSATLYKTVTNCSGVGTSASPSVVTCAAAPAGAFSCATAASGATCTVNTTAVTANSDIVVSEVSYVGTRLGVTCNTTPSSLPTILLASIVAGTSFTINVPTITTNPACYVYTITN